MGQPDIFKVKLADKIYAGFKGKLFSITLTKSTTGTRTPGALMSGTNPVETSYTVEGYVDKTGSNRVQAEDFRQVGQEHADDWTVVIMGKSLPANIEPRPSDKITAEGATKTIEKVDRDPAGATYTCLLKA